MKPQEQGLRSNAEAMAPGAQTERRGGAGPVKASLGAAGSPGEAAYGYFFGPAVS
jgi:hypothetical protein